MKNSKYFPFERNKYYYGKLLSVDDFQLEQRYVNNKRRMTNRFLHGAGVAAGLYVVRIDEKTISLENGFALDSLGREIVVDRPVIRRLSLLEGYASGVENSDKDYVYLCIDYEEEETEAVHNIAGNTIAAGEDQAYNKIKETYRLYLTDTEPEQTILDNSALYEQVQVWHAQDGICIRQVMPKYIQAGGIGEIRFEIENNTKKYLEFSADLILDCLNYEGQTSFTVNFNEEQYEKSGKYVISYQITAAELAEAEGSVRINEKDFQLFLNKEPLPFCKTSLKFPVQIMKGSVRSRIIQDYYRSAMDQIVKLNQRDRLYLAKLHLMRVEGDCGIERIENLPFNQYILNQNLSFALHQLSIQQTEGAGRLERQDRAGSAQKQGNRKEQPEKGILMNQGSYWLDLDGGGQRGDRFISEEITHGLGLGPVFVQAGLEDEEGVVTYGSSEIFPDMDLLLELAVRVYPERGTFQIAGRLREQVIKSGIMVRWAAVMNVEEKAVKKIVRKIFIKPSVLELAARESHYLEAVCTNMDDKTVTWQLQKNGGSISPNGMYTAPNLPGVYEVVAQSAAYPDVRASIFVVVRDA